MMELDSVCSEFLDVALSVFLRLTSGCTDGDGARY